MARGIDTSRDPGRALTRPMGAMEKSRSMWSVNTRTSTIADERARQQYLVGPAEPGSNKDDGHRSLAMPAPAGGLHPRPGGGAEGPGLSHPAFEGAKADDIRLATMQVATQNVMGGLMQHAPTNAPMSPLRLQDPRADQQTPPSWAARPGWDNVKSHIDERIKLEPGQSALDAPLPRSSFTLPPARRPRA